MSTEDARKQAGPLRQTPGRSEDGDDHQRRWYHLRPEPRSRGDVAGFNHTYWLFIVALLVIL
jgi:hypothetical protein